MTASRISGTCGCVVVASMFWSASAQGTTRCWSATACVSASLTHSLKMDSRIERRLHDIAQALEHVEPASPEVAAYCSRLNKLVSAVLVNAAPVDEHSGEAERASSDTTRVSVRPGVRRR